VTEDLKEVLVIDTGAVRSHFPALDPASHGGAAPVYFDNPAGTQIAAEALAGINGYLVQRNANHDGNFRASRESDAMVADARAALAEGVRSSPDGGESSSPRPGR
jgi:selenocysteine lyase/cysteine desulfurase